MNCLLQFIESFAIKCESEGGPQIQSHFGSSFVCFAFHLAFFVIAVLQAL